MSSGDWSSQTTGTGNSKNKIHKINKNDNTKIALLDPSVPLKSGNALMYSMFVVKKFKLGVRKHKCKT